MMPIKTRKGILSKQYVINLLRRGRAVLLKDVSLEGTGGAPVYFSSCVLTKPSFGFYFNIYNDQVGTRHELAGEGFGLFSFFSFRVRVYGLSHLKFTKKSKISINL